jgi:hypothetical protein
VPSTAKALSVNVTLVVPTGDGFVTLFAGDGTLAAYASTAGNAVHEVLDVNGYFE